MLKITPDQIVERYWRCRWLFKRDGSLTLFLPGGGVKVFKEADYVPKNFRTGAS